MSRSIGINTDPLDVEMYIENGLIKGRIITKEHCFKHSAEEQSIIEHIDHGVIEQHILNKYFGSIFLLNYDVPCNATKIIKHDINTSISFNDDYEYFDFMMYAKQNNISGTRRQIYNHYTRSNIDLKPYDHNTNKFYDILLTAKEMMLEKIIIPLANPNYQTIEYYYNDKSFENYDLIASIDNNMYISITQQPMRTHQ